MTNEAFFNQLWARYGNPIAFIGRLRKRMNQIGISQSALARRAGFQPSHVNRYLNFKVTPTMESMAMLDQAVNQLERS